MKPAKMYVPKSIQDLLDFVVSMLSRAPKFLDKTGYFPHRNLDYIFRQLIEGLNVNRPTLGEERYNQLMAMSDEMQARFEADPEDKTGDTLKGCKIIHEMEDILKQVRRKSQPVARAPGSDDTDR